MIVEFGNEKNFVQKTLELINNPRKIEELKKGTQKQLVKYSSEAAWEIIKNKILNIDKK